MSEKPPPDPLARLGDRIEQARKERIREAGGTPRVGGAAGPLGVALRIAVEMVAALAVGVGLGFGFDYFFGTRPWGLIAGFFIGSAAGIVNVFRAAQELGAPHPPKEGEDRPERK